MGALTMMEGRALSKEGDEDAGGLMVVAGVLLTVSGVATGLVACQFWARSRWSRCLDDNSCWSGYFGALRIGIS